MAATVTIRSAHGATVTTTETDITSATIKFKLADNDTNDNNNPIVRPTSGTTYSWRKSLRLRVDATPDVSISNIRFFSDATSWGTGITANAHTKPVANYDQATSADESNVITTDGGSTVTDASTFTSLSPLVVNSGTVLSNPSTGYGTQDLVEMQLAVTSSASRGVKPSPVTTRTYSFRYDEV